MRRSRRRGALGAAAVIIVGAAVIVVLLATTRPSASRAPDLGTFSGYVSRGRDVDAVSASWTVPRVSAGAAPGESSVWVGAQAPGARLTSPFIQVGVVIVQEPDGRSVDRGFWTDTDHRFLPRFLGIVSPGDRVRASLRLRGARWHVVLVDPSRGAARRLVTAQEGAAAFNQAEWLQEDPGRGGHLRDLRPAPYAMTSSVHIDDPRIDGAAPPPSRTFSAWMTLPRLDLAPTSLSAGGFSVRPRRLSPTAARDVRLAIPVNRAAAIFALALPSWLRGGPVRGVAGPASRLDGALLHITSEVRRSDWPSGTLRRRDAVASADDRLTDVVRVAASVPPARRRAWKQRWDAAAQRVTTAGQALSAAVGAPGDVPVSP